MPNHGKQRVLITDGAWGTEFQAAGLAPGACADLWNLDNPAAVSAVAASYVQAGSQVILTNTFCCNRLSAAHWGFQNRVAHMARAGAALSRKAAGDKVKVFGSMGPTGKVLMMGEVSTEEVMAAFAEQAAALAEGGVDAILCETFSDLEEAVLAAQAAQEATALPVAISMTFDSGPDKTATMMGVKPADLASAARKAGIDIVGANCGAGPENFVKIAALFRQATDLPIWIKPNAGLPVVRDGKTVFPLAPEPFAEFAPALIAAGASYLGGCCGTTPAHIQATRKRVDALV